MKTFKINKPIDDALYMTDDLCVTPTLYHFYVCLLDISFMENRVGTTSLLKQYNTKIH